MWAWNRLIAAGMVMRGADANGVHWWLEVQNAPAHQASSWAYRVGKPCVSMTLRSLQLKHWQAHAFCIGQHLL
jgi:hypothetical protein